MEGTLARFAMFVFRRVVKRFVGAYSSRYSAAPTPSGKDITATSASIHALPRIAERTPARSGKRDG